eukprot:scaffold129989_cov63-Phaeocystis_antarctica.AAC.9
MTSTAAASSLRSGASAWLKLGGGLGLGWRCGVLLAQRGRARLLHPLHVAAVEPAVARLDGAVGVEPDHGPRLSALRLERQQRAELGAAVEVHHLALHPGIVRVARVVGVAHEDGHAAGEEPVHEQLELLCLLALLLEVAALLDPLAHRHRDRLPRPHDAAGQRPLVGILP